MEFNGLIEMGSMGTEPLRFWSRSEFLTTKR